ncbi:MAG: D-alanine--D-alanine ligase [Candidatus Aminicenantes bacterium]|nr:D-alanine--D-alanine ligase [Candidatus Aminicenantes bacterium]
MKHKKINIALLFGGRSAEHEISLISATSIYKNLDKKKFEITSIYINKKGDWKIVELPLLAPSALNKGDFFSFLPWGKNASPLIVEADIYFPVLHGPHGEDGTIQGLFEMADVPFVGASVMDSAIGMDKGMTKIILKAKDLPVVKHMIIQHQEWMKQKEAIISKIKKEFPIPFFVKPACLGSSVGISKVREYGQTSAALDEAFRYDQKILVEEGIKGRELECSVLGNDSPLASLPGEIIPYREFYDYRDKYIEGKTSFGIPAELTPEKIEEIRHLSLEAYKAIYCSGMARVDFFMEEKTEKIFISELNTIPGFTEISMYPKLWEVSGLPFPRLLERLIELGLERHKKKKKRKENFIP